MSLDSLHLMSIFVQVAEAGSFTGAARLMNISPSAASKAVARLEDKLGVRLMRRTTRRLSLTAEGEMLLSSCLQIQHELEAVEGKLERGKAMPEGRLRLQATIAFGRLVVVPLLMELTRSHPGLYVDLDLSDRMVNLHDEQYDAAIRVGEPTSDHVITRKLGHMPIVTVASPDYLRRHGRPNTPLDIPKHHCLGYYLPGAHSYRNWEFTDGTLLTAQSGQLNVNHAQSLLEMAIAGHGIAQFGALVGLQAIQDGLLEVVLPEYTAEGPPVYLTYTERRYQPERMRTMIDFLLQRIRADKRWQSIRSVYAYPAQGRTRPFSAGE